MKTTGIFLALFCLLFVPPSWAQRKQGGTNISVSFQDSVRIILENTKKLEAHVVGASFASLWNTFGPDVQQTIRRHSSTIKRKKFPTASVFLNYIGAIVDALNIEKTDASTFQKFLNVAGKVIEQYPAQRAALFFATSRDFFDHHGLHYENTVRVYARDDEYQFDFIDPVQPVAWDDTTRQQTETLPDAQAATDPVVSTPEDSLATAIPSWMTPAPQPTLEGPVIKFRKVTLNIVTAYDSVFIKNTRGSFSLVTRQFVGEGGSFDWTPAGLPQDSVICNFTAYNFNATKPEVKVEIAKLNYLGKTPGFIPGAFEFRSQPRKDSVLSTYPRFKSYQSDLSITGLADANVKYQGGFSLIGKKITSSSVSGDPGRIEVYKDGAKKFTAQSADFIFLSHSITSQKARLVIAQGNDSLVHSQIRMKYTYGDSIQKLLVMKDKGDMRNAPFASSYFNIDFTGDIMRWNLNADSLDIQTDGGRNIVPMIIQSVDFYDAEDYRLLKGVNFTFHPLNVVMNYYLKTGFTEFYSGDLAAFTKRGIPEMKSAVSFLAQKGLVFYDPRTDKVQLRPKAIEFYQAFKGISDYDNLKIHSIIDSTANATLNFKKGELTVRGVEAFNVSDSLNVRIKPDSSVITLLQNRDIKFDGTVTAGNFEITGKDFTLKYDSFFINLIHIDSINFYVTEKNSRGQEVKRKVSNSMVGADSTAAAAGGLGDISRSSGTLFISRADNKSGKDKIPNYPRLDATTGGVFYFDGSEILGGVYDRSMFFVVPPFKLDSLNDADPASINFEGTFVSSGMFPNFKDKLSTQADKSLGFSHDIPAGGYQLYKGDGTMNGSLRMNNQGLRGVGQIDFLAASVASPDFIFYPDSVIAKGSRAWISEKQFGAVNFPQASLPNYQMKWYPKQDKMQLKNTSSPFNFYDSTAQMLGTLTISKAGVLGSGKFETRGTELISRTMNFTSTQFTARHGRFRVKSDDPNKNLLSGNDVRLKFNIAENYADISPEIEGTAAIDFPYAQFKTSIPNARWNITDGLITMRKDPNVPIETSYFYTTRKDLDSLSFYAEKAEYNLKTQQLKVSGIPDIIVADARITPENNEVLILENARIGTLKNTTIILDTLNGYHRLTQGVVDIVSRKEFSGYATYQYVNFLNDTFAIKMTNFHLEPIAPAEGTRKSNRKTSSASMQTVGSGSVTEKESLVLGAGMYYKGDMTMYATRPALQLSGFVKLGINKIKNYNTWIKYNQTGDETEVLVDFDNAVTEEGKRATAGLHFSGVDNSLYITFVSNKKDDDDENFFEPSGSLFYDKESKEYKIEDREKAAGNKLSGKVFAYNDETMQVRFEGPIKLFPPLKNFNVTATCIGSGSLETNEIKMNSLVAIDTDIAPMALDLMAKDLQNVIKNESIAEGLGDPTDLLYKIADIVGERLAKDYETKSGQGYISLATLPPLVKPLVISDVNMKWSQKQKAFYSEGNIGISNIGKNDINGGFEGFLEVKKAEDGSPVFHLFIKASPDSWYYFGFEDNRILVHSSNGDFNSVISKKSTGGKAKVGEVAFVPGSEDETLAFINRFRKEYYGIEVPYNLSDSSQAVEKKKDEKKKSDDDGF